MSSLPSEPLECLPWTLTSNHSLDLLVSSSQGFSVNTHGLSPAVTQGSFQRHCDLLMSYSGPLMLVLLRAPLANPSPLTSKPSAVVFHQTPRP
jgi:hypothetical protein